MAGINESLTRVLEGLFPGDEPLASLAAVTAARRELDRIERRLIEVARGRGESWARLAPALGVASRQAAEQRWLRLRAGEGRDPAVARANRRRQQSIDTTSPMGALRAAVTAALGYIERDEGWDGRHPRAILARTSLLAAEAAPPGALYALVAHACGDLESVPAEALELDRLRAALAAATPAAPQS